MNDQLKIPHNYYAIMKWAGIFIIIGGLKLAVQIILPFLLALFISLMLYQGVYWLQSKKVNKNLAIFIVLILFLGSIFALGDLLGTSLHDFRNSLPEYKEKLISHINDGSSKLDLLGIEISENELFEHKPGKMMEVLLDGISQVQQVIGRIFFVLLLTIFLLFEIDSFPIKFNIIFSRQENIKVKRKVNLITHNLRHYLGIKTLTSLATGLFIYLGLLLLGVKFAILWATLAFILNYIPNIGSLIAAIPAILFSGILLGGSTLLLTGILYLAVNFIIGSVIEPKIMGKDMGLSTSIIFISLVFWGWMFGPVGMFLSVPLTMVLKIFLQSSDDSKYFAILIGSPAEAKEMFENDRASK